jgi:ribose transport system substrate-binding protein
MARGIYLGLIVGACLAAGCAGPRESFKYRIVVIPKGTTHVFWKSIHAGAVKAARECGDTNIVWEGPAKEDQRNEQLQIVERFTSEGVSALILAPCDKKTLVGPVDGALKADIPVVIIDSGLDLSEQSQKSPRYLGYVATDNRQGGVLGARRMIDLMKGKSHPKVLMIRYQAGSESTEQREAGFRETIQAAKDINYIEAPDEAGATVDSAQQVAERLLSDHKDLDGIFVPNESSTTGVLRALQVLKRAGQVKLVGFDASEVLIHALRSGELHGLVLQDPFNIGYQAVLRAHDVLEGKPLPEPRTKYNKPQVATPDNLEDPVIKPLYDRDLKPYLDE